MLRYTDEGEAIIDPILFYRLIAELNVAKRAGLCNPTSTLAYQQEEARLKSNIAHLTTRLNDLTLQKSLCNASIANLNVSIQTLTAEIQTLNTQITNSVINDIAMRAKVDATEAARATFETELKNVKMERDELAINLMKAKDELKQAQNEQVAIVRAVSTEASPAASAPPPPPPPSVDNNFDPSTFQVTIENARFEIPVRPGVKKVKSILVCRYCNSYSFSKSVKGYKLLNSLNLGRDQDITAQEEENAKTIILQNTYPLVSFLNPPAVKHILGGNSLFQDPISASSSSASLQEINSTNLNILRDALLAHLAPVTTRTRPSRALAAPQTTLATLWGTFMNNMFQGSTKLIETLGILNGRMSTDLSQRLAPTPVISQSLLNTFYATLTGTPTGSSAPLAESVIILLLRDWIPPLQFIFSLVILPPEDSRLKLNNRDTFDTNVLDFRTQLARFDSDAMLASFFKLPLYSLFSKFSNSGASLESMQRQLILFNDIFKFQDNFADWSKIIATIRPFFKLLKSDTFTHDLMTPIRLFVAAWGGNTAMQTFGYFNIFQLADELLKPITLKTRFGSSPIVTRVQVFSRVEHVYDTVKQTLSLLPSIKNIEIKAILSLQNVNEFRGALADAIQSIETILISAEPSSSANSPIAPGFVSLYEEQLEIANNLEIKCIKMLEDYKRCLLYFDIDLAKMEPGFAAPITLKTPVESLSLLFGAIRNLFNVLQIPPKKNTTAVTITAHYSSKKPDSALDLPSMYCLYCNRKQQGDLLAMDDSGAIFCNIMCHALFQT